MKAVFKVSLGALLLVSACAVPDPLASVAVGPGEGSKAAGGGYQVQQSQRPRLPYVRPRPPLGDLDPSRVVRWETEVETRLLEALNRMRRERGLAPLRQLTSVRRVARLHSLDQANRNYTSNVSPDGMGTEDRLKAAGITQYYYAYALAHRTTAATPEEAANRILMAMRSTPGQMAAALARRADTVGIGVVKTSDGSYVVTQIVMRRYESGG